jgi:hypothetical protein
MISTKVFRRNVMNAAVLKPKAIKASLRFYTRTVSQVLLVKSVVSLSRSVGELINIENSYLLGFPKKATDSADVEFVLGEIGESIAILSKVLKVKLPSGNRKMRIKGTLADNLLELQSIAVCTLSCFESLVLGQLPTLVVGAGEAASVEVNKYAALENQLGVLKTVKANLEALIPLYWGLCYELIGKTPAYVLSLKMSRLAEAFPEVAFEEDKPKAEAVEAQEQKEAA